MKIREVGSLWLGLVTTFTATDIDLWTSIIAASIWTLIIAVMWTRNQQHAD